MVVELIPAPTIDLGAINEPNMPVCFGFPLPKRLTTTHDGHAPYSNVGRYHHRTGPTASN
jgi:hypothetical protein